MTASHYQDKEPSIHIAFDLLFHIAQIQLGDIFIADNDNAAVAAKNFIHLKQMLLQAIADHNFVLMLVFSRTG